MRIELNYKAKTLETAICEAIVTYLGYGMPAREIIDQLMIANMRFNGYSEEAVLAPGKVGGYINRSSHW
jgi:hypothetical protein